MEKTNVVRQQRKYKHQSTFWKVSTKQYAILAIHIMMSCPKVYDE